MQRNPPLPPPPSPPPKIKKRLDSNAPQHNKAPPVFRPHVHCQPALTADQLPPPDTATGTVLSVVLPSPSGPDPFHPAKRYTGGDEPRSGWTMALTLWACGGGGGDVLRIELQTHSCISAFEVQCITAPPPPPAQVTPVEQGADGFHATHVVLAVVGVGLGVLHVIVCIGLI
jgi:hypothetical protein